MGSGNTSSTNPTATNTGLANAFLGNRPLQQTYTPMPMPTATSSSFADLSKQGSLPGLTGSLIGSSGMPALPQPSGPMPLPPPPVPAPAPAPTQNPNLYYSGKNVARGQSPLDKDGKPVFRINSAHGR